ncbi:hypothetical protein DUHN55_33480 [Helicobacter pylori]
MAVEDRGDLVGAAQLAGRTLAELGALVGDQTDLIAGHVLLLGSGNARAGSGRVSWGGGLDVGRGADVDVDARASPQDGTASITDRCDRAASLAEATPRY